MKPPLSGSGTDRTTLGSVASSAIRVIAINLNIVYPVPYRMRKVGACADLINRCF